MGYNTRKSGKLNSLTCGIVTGRMDYNMAYGTGWAGIQAHMNKGLINNWRYSLGGELDKLYEQVGHLADNGSADEQELLGLMADINRVHERVCDMFMELREYESEIKADKQTNQLMLNMEKI